MLVEVRDVTVENDKILVMVGPANRALGVEPERAVKTRASGLGDVEGHRPLPAQGRNRAAVLFDADEPRNAPRHYPPRASNRVVLPGRRGDGGNVPTASHPPILSLNLLI